MREREELPGDLAVREEKQQCGVRVSDVQGFVYDSEWELCVAAGSPRSCVGGGELLWCCSGGCGSLVVVVVVLLLLRCGRNNATRGRAIAATSKNLARVILNCCTMERLLLAGV